MATDAEGNAGIDVIGGWMMYLTILPLYATL